MYSKLNRNADKIYSDGMVDLEQMVVAKQSIKICFPEYYVAKKLASFGSDIYMVGVFAIIANDEHYAVSLAPAMIKTEPSKYQIVKYKGVAYYELFYEEGDVIISDKAMVKNAAIASSLYSLFVDQGKTPWFFESLNPNIDDKLSLFINCNEYADMKIGDDPAAISLILSATAKSPIDNNIPYRLYVNDNLNDALPATYVGMRNIAFIASSTISRMTGNYYDDSVGSALINQTTKVEGLDKVFRE